MLSETVLREMIIGGDIETPIVDVIETEAGAVDVHLLDGRVLRYEDAERRGEVTTRDNAERCNERGG